MEREQSPATTPQHFATGGNFEGTDDDPRESPSSEWSACPCRSLVSVRRLVSQVVEGVCHRAGVLYWPGAVPGAVETQTVQAKRGFQRKAMGLLCLESVVSLIVAIGVAALDALQPTPPELFAYFVGFTLMGLKLSSLLRMSFPWNYAAVATLSVCGGVTFGLMTRYLLDAYEWLFEEQPALRESHLLFVSAHVVALLIMLLIVIASRRRALRMIVVSSIATTITNILLLVIWGITGFCHLGWLCGMTMTVSACIMWIGYDMDRLLTKLMIDEYLLPSILVWGDFLVVITIGVAAFVVYALIVDDARKPEDGLVNTEAGNSSHDLKCCRWSCVDCIYLENPSQSQAEAAAHEPTPVIPPQARMAWVDTS